MDTFPRLASARRSEKGARLAVLMLLASLLLLSACSFRFLYSQLDWLVPWRLSEYVTFDSEQRSLLEQRLFARINWHCGTQLDDYAAWFRELKQAPLPYSREDIERYYQRTNDFWQVLMQQISPDVAALLASANPDQVAELFDNLERRNRELEEEYVTPGWNTVQRQRIKRMSEILVRWVGPLNAAQRRTLADWARELGQGGEAWMQSRRRWQAALREALKLRREPERFEARIEQLMVDPQSLWPESYRLEYARMRSLTLDMLAEVSALQTPEQIRHFRYELDSWADDFEHLACTPPGGASEARRTE